MSSNSSASCPAPSPRSALRSTCNFMMCASSGRCEKVLIAARSEEHTSELQSPCNLVCRLLLEKKTNTLAIAPRNLIPPPDLSHQPVSPAPGGPLSILHLPALCPPTVVAHNLPTKTPPLLVSSD